MIPSNKFFICKNITLRRGLNFALETHNGQRRASGEPYITHPICISRMLTDLGADVDLIIAGLLHDALEEGNITPNHLRPFGCGVIRLVEAVTKPNFAAFFTPPTNDLLRQSRWIDKSMTFGKTACILKLVDRLHNIRTISFLPEEKQMKIASQTLEFFLPLANIYSFSWIAFELRIRSLKILLTNNRNVLNSDLISHPFLPQEIKNVKTFISFASKIP